MRNIERWCAWSAEIAFGLAWYGKEVDSRIATNIHPLFLRPGGSSVEGKQFPIASARAHAWLTWLLSSLALSGVAIVTCWKTAICRDEE